MKVNQKTSFLKLMYSILGVLILVDAYGQVEPFPQANQVIPPSPNAAALAKYGEVPVSLNTGTPNISIPIYEIKGKKINTPISLSYNASGNKVADKASWVGLGWSLNAGGVITRTVNGLPDEIPNGYFAKYVYWLENIKDQQHEDNMDDPKCRWLYDAASGLYDLQPDEFHFNFDGYSGKIMIDAQTQEAVIFPRQGLKIERIPEGNYYWSWIITTDNGTRYIFSFDDVETTTLTTSTLNYISTWNLSKIEDVSKNDEILFHYTTNSGEWSEPVGQITSQTLKSIYPNTGCSNPSMSSSDQEVVSTYTKTLEMIEYDNVTVQFISANDRLDIESFSSLKRLNGIYVRNKQTDEIIKTFTLEHDYFNKDADSYKEKRLKLISVRESDKPSYKFSYNPNEDFPFYESTSIDYFGFYNGEDNGNMLVPEIPDKFRNGYVDTYVGANRSIKRNGSLMGILEKVEYPTGGYTSFEFETNKDWVMGEYYQARNESVSETGGYKDESERSSFEKMIRSTDEFIDPVGGKPNVSSTSPFTVIQGTTIQISVSRTGDQGTGIMEARLYPYPLTSDMTDYERITVSDKKLINAGDYVLAVFVGEMLSEDQGFSVSFSWTDPVEHKYMYTDFSGARIKKMTTSDGVNIANNMVTEYFYAKNYLSVFNGLQATEKNASLRIFNKPNNHYFTRCGDLVMTSYITDLDGKMVKNSGSYYGYDEVAIVKNGGSDGITIQKFANSPNSNHRSQLISEKVYDMNLHLVKEDSTVYDIVKGSYLFTGNIYTANIVLDRFEPKPSNDMLSVGPWYYFRESFHSQTSSFYFPVQTISKVYDSNNKKIVSQSITKYNGINDIFLPHSNPTEMSQFSSDGKEIITKLKYIGDFDYARCFIDYEQDIYDQSIQEDNCQLELQSCNDNLFNACYASYQPCKQTYYGLWQLRKEMVEDRCPSFTYSVNCVSKVYKDFDNFFGDWRNDFMECKKEFKKCYYDGPCFDDYNSCKPDPQIPVDNYYSCIESEKAASSDRVKAIINMQNAHMLSAVAEKEVWQVKDGDTTLLSALFTTYDPVNFNPKEMYFIEEEGVINKSDFELSFINAENELNMAHQYKLKRTFDKYDNNGNILEYHDENSFPVSFIWGYNNMYPIAKILNASTDKIFHTSFENMLDAISFDDAKTGEKYWNGIYTIPTSKRPIAGEYILTYWEKDGDSEWTLVKKTYNGSSNTIGETGKFIDEIRIYPKNAQMNTYTYDPLVGITSETDPNGLTTSYKYDMHGRLIEISDFDGTILKKFEYNYGTLYNGTIH